MRRFQLEDLQVEIFGDTVMKIKESKLREMISGVIRESLYPSAVNQCADKVDAFVDELLREYDPETVEEVLRGRYEELCKANKCGITLDKARTAPYGE